MLWAVTHLWADLRHGRDDHAPSHLRVKGAGNRIGIHASVDAPILFWIARLGVGFQARLVVLGRNSVSNCIPVLLQPKHIPRWINEDDYAPGCLSRRGSAACVSPNFWNLHRGIRALCALWGLRTLFRWANNIHAWTILRHACNRVLHSHICSSHDRSRGTCDQPSISPLKANDFIRREF